MPFDANYSHSYGGKPAGKQKAGNRKPKAVKKMKRKSMKQIFGK